MDGIEEDLEDRAQVVRLSIVSEIGRQVARRYGVQGVPTLILCDQEGNLVEQMVGVPNRGNVVERVNSLFG